MKTTETYANVCHMKLANCVLYVCVLKIILGIGEEGGQNRCPNKY